MANTKVNKKQLNYTHEMEEQDRLWKEEKEDLQVMERLFYQIIEQAKQLGFNGKYVIYELANETICEIYDNEEEYELASLGKYECEFMFGYCKRLIECLEENYLNK